jgi:ribosome-associated toxin RatA of RatAB toxin-antitoxin module
MRTVDTTRIAAPVERVFRAAEAVERWPELLPHYRWVRVLERRPDGGVVEMAAWRPFGPVGYPTWWVSEMHIDRAAPAVYYRHVRGVTTGMDVVWRLEPEGTGTAVTIVHEWSGPRWPLVGGIAAAWVIGPVFVHGIASRTLAGIKRAVERGESA